MADLEREQASPWSELGNQRCRRYQAAFDRVIQSVNDGYHLEAIAILDSLIGDRLYSRLSYNYHRRFPTYSGKDYKLESKAKSLGRLCEALLDGDLMGNPGLETDPEFRDTANAIKNWVDQRNGAMHGTAKILRSQEAPESFLKILETYRQTACNGIALLQQFDILDTNDRARNNAAPPATSPNAFFPEKRANLLRRRR